MADMTVQRPQGSPPPSGGNEPPPHPGRVTYLNGNTGEVVSEKPVAEVPEHLRFAPDETGALVPVVKVVATVAGAQRSMREYGPDDQLLRTTLQRKSEAT
jgi:hypothetical protein